MAQRQKRTRKTVAYHLAVKSTTTSLDPADSNDERKCEPSLICVTGIMVLVIVL